MLRAGGQNKVSEALNFRFALLGLNITYLATLPIPISGISFDLAILLVYLAVPMSNSAQFQKSSSNSVTSSASLGFLMSTTSGSAAGRPAVSLFLRFVGAGDSGDCSVVEVDFVSLDGLSTCIALLESGALDTAEVDVFDAFEGDFICPDEVEADWDWFELFRFV
jgi:hypothetical protein